MQRFRSRPSGTRIHRLKSASYLLHDLSMQLASRVERPSTTTIIPAVQDFIQRKVVRVAQRYEEE
jgi:hypothetical protein